MRAVDEQTLEHDVQHIGMYEYKRCRAINFDINVVQSGVVAEQMSGRPHQPNDIDDSVY